MKKNIFTIVATLAFSIIVIIVSIRPPLFSTDIWTIIETGTIEEILNNCRVSLAARM
jgi:hypothetical protein